MSLLSHTLLLVALCLSSVLASGVSARAGSVDSSAQFNETLLLRPQHDGKVMLHWEFDVRESVPGGRHFTLFPKSLGEILFEFHVHAMSLSLSAGRWVTEEFGYESAAPDEEDGRSQRIGNTTADPHRLTRMPVPIHAPHGAELWAVIDDDESATTELVDSFLSPSRESSSPLVDRRWRQLQASLSGLFCASLNQMSASYSSRPLDVFDDDLVDVGVGVAGFRYATLPRESVCTENLAPFVKLLPCRAKRGLAAMLEPSKLYAAHYHSVQIRVRPVYSSAGVLDGWRLTQSVTALLDPTLVFGEAGWSLSRLLEGGPACACPLSSHASLHVHLPAAFHAQFASGGGVGDAPSFRITPPADFETTFGHSRHMRLSYDLKKRATTTSGDSTEACPRGGMDWSIAYVPRPSPAQLRRPLAQLALVDSMDTPIRVQRYLSASTLHSGTLHTHLRNPSSTHHLEVQLFDALPWFCQTRLSTLSVTVDGRPLPDDDLISHWYTPAVRRGVPAQWFFHMRLRPGAAISVSIQFDKSLLLPNEYPPDVSRGLDIGSATVRVRAASSSSIAPSSSGRWYRFSTVGLLVLLPFPDFSMPFNVIAFTSTILAFFVGTVFNMTAASTEEILKRRTTNDETSDEEEKKKRNLWQRIRGAITPGTPPLPPPPPAAAVALEATARDKLL